jgi:antitoxin (DNA-binding transcriptional repressor) of toxin-antitoxin stability system
MIQQASLNEAQVHLRDLIEAALNGQTVVITKDDQPAARLAPEGHLARHRQFGSTKGLIAMADDFAPLVSNDAAFDAYVAGRLW